MDIGQSLLYPEAHINRFKKKKSIPAAVRIMNILHPHFGSFSTISYMGLVLKGYVSYGIQTDH